MRMIKATPHDVMDIKTTVSSLVPTNFTWGAGQETKSVETVVLVS